MCIYADCKIRPCYNFEGISAKYCFSHKFKDMVDVAHKTCIEPNCKTRPTYNIEGNKIAIYCAIHKTEGMINIISNRCIYPNCKTLPCYNKSGETKRLYCNIHKLEGMVDIASKFCIESNCKTRPIYNLENELIAKYCFKHKTEKMIDVKNKTCIEPNCKIRPSYNIVGELKAIYCVKHKLKNMVDVVNKTCIIPNCKIQSSYNTDGEIKGLYCASHKLKDMVNVKDKTCKTHLCSTRVHDKYDGYCLYCFINIFPDKPVSRNYKTKERATVEHVINKYPELTWIADKVVKDGCSKRRPDLLLDLGYQIIIIEVDENQHTDYDCSCENKRIMELSQDLGHRPIIFIRFNPDDYLDTGNTITSCWSNNKNGICTIKKSKQDEWTQRLNSLTSQLDYWIDPVNKTNKTIETVQLFYDI